MTTTTDHRLADLAIQRARRVKAEKLADALMGAGADGTEEFGPATWELAALAARVPPPSDLTRDLAMWIVRDRKARP